MQNTETNQQSPWSVALRLLGLFLLVPALVLTGCDSSGDNGSDDDGDDNDTPFTVEAYDTTTVDGQDAIRVTDVNSGGIGYVDENGDDVTSVTWTNDFVYILEEYIFVNLGQTLNIEPGTVIKGAPGSGENATALVVASGGTINADGNPGSSDPSAADPIIFTAQADDGSGLGRDVRGQWGGIILLGDAPLNTVPATQSVEGVPGDDPRAEYGGSNAGHNVGTFRFVQIRHSGSALAAGDEIQALTLGGVGNGSTIEYVEAFASSDDGFEFFGGTVNTRYLVGAFNADDTFDMDQGMTGNHQFWLGIQSPVEAGRIAEMDGGTDPEDGTPLATPHIFNATYIGIGPGENAQGDNNSPFLIHRDNNASSYYNSVFLEGGRDAGLQVEDLASGADSRARQEAGDLNHKNNLWWNIGPSWDPGATTNPTTFEDIIQLTEDDQGNEINPSYRGDLAQYLRDNGNQLLTSSPIQSVSRESGTNGLNPLASGDATSGAPTPDAALENSGVNGSLEDTGYYGAFGTTNWAKGWTLLDQNGYFN
ncbi:hypothetical protein [Longibacter salinarum]|nr:hypothetical protein [Longibacter salinarum]